MGVLVATGIAGAVVFLLLLVFRRDLVGVDLSGRSLLRMYLYLASLVAIFILVAGFAALLDWGLATTFGGEAVYGRPPIEAVCPPSEKCPDPAQLAQQYLHQREQQQSNDLIRGLTFVVFGAVLWGAHRFARSRAADAGERRSALRRAYVALGTFAFGLAAVVLLPVGTYVALSAALLPAAPDVYRQGVADNLAPGVMALPVWLVYLRRLVTDFRTEGAAVPRVARPGPVALPG